MTFLKEHCISSAVEESIKPADLDESLTFIWSLLVSLSRCDGLLSSSSYRS
jgi:hypothetical protein